MTQVFAPVALPTTGPGELRSATIADGIASWVDAPAMTALLAEFRSDPLPDGPLGHRLAALETISEKRWDYRNGRERHEADGEGFPAERDARIRAATGALGLAGQQAPTEATYDHILVLGAGVRTMVARAELAATVVDGGIQAATIAGLGSVRPVAHQAEAARQLGLPECPTEGDAVDAALRRAFRRGDPTGTRSGTSDIGQPWWVRSYEDKQPAVHVLAAPSTRAGQRANTADTLVGWADLLQPSPEATRLLLVTTDIFVPFQHCDAVRLLGLPHGCRIETIGFDTATNPWVTKPETFQILQEVRSAIRSMRALYLALTG